MAPMNNWIAMYLILHEICELLPTITLNYVIFYVPNRQNKISKLIQIEDLISIPSNDSSLSSNKTHNQLRELHHETPSNTFLFDSHRKEKSQSLLENNFIKLQSKYANLDEPKSSFAINEKMDDSYSDTSRLSKLTSKNTNRKLKMRIAQDGNYRLMNKSEE